MEIIIHDHAFMIKSQEKGYNKTTLSLSSVISLPESVSSASIYFNTPLSSIYHIGAS